MKYYKVTGMSCAACQSHVEKAVSAVPGVSAVGVNLLTGGMSVEGDFTDEEIVGAVKNAGYSAAPKDAKAAASENGVFREDESKPLLKRLLISLGFLLILVYVSMGRDLFGLPLPAFFENDPAAAGLLQMILSAAVLIINGRFFVSGFRGLLHKAPNMDTLVALGSSVSFLWSTVLLFGMTDPANADPANTLKDLYFCSAAMILVLITVGKLLEAKSRGRTTDALRGLTELAPKTATVLKNGKETVIPASGIAVGDLFTVKPGESIPADGVVKSGETAADESALTGESMPADKAPGDKVFAATVNLSGFITCEAVKVGTDTALARIIETVENAAAGKAPIARTADKVAGVFVPAVTLIAAVTLTVWLLLGKEFGFALERAISVLVISCPCALGLATPVAITVAGGVGAKRGILFKTAAAIEETGRIKIAVLDKTGTVTEGRPETAGVFPAEGVSETELLEAAVTAECKSEHPLAGAVVREAERRGIAPKQTDSFRALPGRGVFAVSKGDEITGGSAAFIRERGSFVPDGIGEAAKGCSPVLFAKNGKYLGMIAVADAVRNDAADAVRELKEMGIRTVLLTGDDPATAKAVSEKIGTDAVIAGVLPDEKAAVIEKLKALGVTLMAGDGINDAPALTEADVGIAVGTGTDIAIDSADAVLTESGLGILTAAVKLSSAALKTIRENLFWAFFYNAICIPLAAGCFIGLNGLKTDPMISAAAMSLSSFFVVTNALRLNAFDPKKNSAGYKIKKPVTEEEFRSVIGEIQKLTEVKKMTKILKVEGMMCPRCEAHVKKALEEIPGVTAAEADHLTGKVTVTLNEATGEAALEKAVTEAGYTFLGAE